MPVDQKAVCVCTPQLTVYPLLLLSLPSCLVPRHHPTHRATRTLAAAFFVMFRVVVMFFLVYCMYVYQSVVPYWVFTAGMVSGSVVLLMSASLMHRLIRSDFGPSASNYSNAWSSSNAAAAVAVDGRQERTSGSTTTAAGGDQMSAQMSGDDPVLRPGSLSSPTSHSLSSKKIC